MSQTKSGESLPVGLKLNALKNVTNARCYESLSGVHRCDNKSIDICTQRTTRTDRTAPIIKTKSESKSNTHQTLCTRWIELYMYIYGYVFVCITRAIPNSWWWWQQQQRYIANRMNYHITFAYTHTNT